MLPSLDPAATIEFYGALGFRLSCDQRRPYLYLAFALDDLELHFKDPAPRLDARDELSGGALIFLDDLAPLHRRFADGLRAGLGRIPTAGVPRISRFRTGDTRFSLYDPSGNCLLFVVRDEPDIEYGGSRELSGLARAMDNVRIFRDFKNDDQLAARALDAALARRRDQATRIEWAAALADRAELALALDDNATAERMRAELTALDLDESERSQIAVELTALADIERWKS
ncbi:glyoxalase [Mycolicibacterium brumae]|uniref:Glyoxalase n=1 Tax=Mycolicibacterium brumae TaxID=85968 RepID=A0A2G5PBJ5_9MYCO|nr:glyoxalase [Mycolicibacterium brumae]PIB75430.1 glyoxalase [Mycolicibacterium brumae]